MKKIFNKRIPLLLVFSMTLIITMFTSCNKDDISGGTPVITEVRNYAPAPNDTLVTSINPGQWIVIHGKNLEGAVKITINGSPIYMKPSLFSDNSAVVQVPVSIPFNNVDPDDLNTIGYETSEGSTTFKFNVNAPPATITGNSLLASTKVGDSVYVYGTNLFLIKSLTIAGVAIAPLKTVSDGSSIGFIFPVINAPQPWESVVVAASGTYTFSISIVPLISDVSNANPSEGDEIRVYGKNLNGVTSVKFGSATITTYTEDPDGFYVQFKAPNQWNYTSGLVTIVTTYGTASTPYKVNTQNGDKVGLLADFEWGDYFGWAWWGDNINLTSNKSDFNGTMGMNSSQYVYMDAPVLAAGATNYLPLGNSNTGNKWIPVANLSDPVENWGLQFEISVAHTWNGSTLYFRTEFANDTYVARFEPWKISAAKTVDIKTEGWQTVTIPLTAFRTKDAAGVLGNGNSLTSLINLLGTTGASSYNATLKNFGDSPTKTGFYGAIDNIRVVKLK